MRKNIFLSIITLQRITSRHKQMLWCLWLGQMGTGIFFQPYFITKTNQSILEV